MLAGQGSRHAVSARPFHASAVRTERAAKVNLCITLVNSLLCGISRTCRVHDPALRVQSVCEDSAACNFAENSMLGKGANQRLDFKTQDWTGPVANARYCDMS